MYSNKAVIKSPLKIFLAREKRAICGFFWGGDNEAKFAVLLGEKPAKRRDTIEIWLYCTFRGMKFLNSKKCTITIGSFGANSFLQSAPKLYKVKLPPNGLISCFLLNCQIMDFAPKLPI